MSNDWQSKCHQHTAQRRQLRSWFLYQRTQTGAWSFVTKACHCSCHFSLLKLEKKLPLKRNHCLINACKKIDVDFVQTFSDKMIRWITGIMENQMTIHWWMESVEMQAKNDTTCLHYLGRIFKLKQKCGCKYIEGGCGFFEVNKAYFHFFLQEATMAIFLR